MNTRNALSGMVERRKNHEKVHLFLVFLALLGLSGCTETQKKAKQVLPALVRSHLLHQQQLV